MNRIGCLKGLENIKNYTKYILFIFLFCTIIVPVYADQNIHDNKSGVQDCSSCHFARQTTKISSVSQVSSFQSNSIQFLSTANVTGNITLITSLGQNWYQQGIYGPNTSDASIDNSWGWTFFDETPPSNFIKPPEKVNQRNNIYALLLDSGNNSNPIKGANVTANITYWIYDGLNYTNHTIQVQLTEDMNRSGFYSGNFYFYGGTTYKSSDMSRCDGCHLSIYGGIDTQPGYFPGNYIAIITAQADNKTSQTEISFEVTPWGCEDCHGSGNQHKTSSVDMDSACYLCHSINEIVHTGTNAGNPHQNTAHRNIKCTDCHTNKSLKPQTFNGVTFIQGGMNNAPLPQYNYTITQLNSGTHTNLTCIDCHNDLTLSNPQGGYKQNNYTINSTINKYNPSFASIQQFQDYYIINVTSGGSLTITLDWEGTSNIGFYLYPPNFNPKNGTSPYYDGSTFTNKPEIYTNIAPMAGKWILEIYGYDLFGCDTCTWMGTLQPPINYTINSTYPIQQKNLPVIPECNSCHNSSANGGAFTKDQIPDWNPGFAHTDTNKDGTPDVQCRMCHNAMHNITIKGCQTCHTTAPTSHPIGEPAFSQYTLNQCLACHGDPHKVTIGGGCIGCHSSQGTRFYVNTSLFGKHANISEPDQNVTDADCMGCHFGAANITMSPDAGLGAANYSNTYFCEDCHASTGRNPAQYANVSSTYRKDGLSHGKADCTWCHIAGNSQPRPLSADLRYHNHGVVPSDGPKGTAAGKNCLSCHYYANLPDLPFHAPGEKHSSYIGPGKGGCDSCHSNADNHAVSYLNSGYQPSVQGLTVTSPVISGNPAQVEATVVDTAGMMAIAAAQYRVANASGTVIDWTNMTPTNGGFSLITQPVNASIDTSGMNGSYTVQVKGMASAPKTDLSKPYYPLNGKWSSISSATLTVFEPTGYVNGTVRDSNGSAISGAGVSTNTSVSTTTNVSGYYSLSLVSGTYQLIVNKEPEYYFNNSVTVNVTAHTTAARDIVLVKKQTGSITGNVTN